MGSDFSFPILCLVSFLIGCETKNLVTKLLGIKKDKEFRETVIQMCPFGVNGDDFVCQDVANRWLGAVDLVSGVPEPSKSPFDRRYFTINSQLWKIGYTERVRRSNLPREYYAEEVGTVLPSMLAGINSKLHLVPAESWIGLLASPLMSAERLNEVGIDLVLMPELPVSWGGLGQFHLLDGRIPERVQFNRIVFARESRDLSWFDATPKSMDMPDAICNGSTTIVGASLLTDGDAVNEPTRSGFVDKRLFKSLQQQRFGTKVVRWSKGVLRKCFPAVALPYLRRWTNMLWRDGTKDACMKWLTEVAWNEHRGRIFVKGYVPLTSDLFRVYVKPASPWMESPHSDYEIRDLTKRIKSRISAREGTGTWRNIPDLDGKKKGQRPALERSCGHLGSRFSLP
jgi:hypothetical protein